MKAPFIVHEWGTFLAVAGSDGVVIDGMYHEEHALPQFVHERTGDATFSRLATLKGETPVIYFYTDQPRHVRVSVDFPTGTWTHWYPSAVRAGRVLEKDAPKKPLTNGHIGWVAHLTPPSPKDRLPQTEPGALWNFARQVPQAATVHMSVDASVLEESESGTLSSHTVPGSGESERFLFYRGLGKADLPVRFLPDTQGGQLTSSQPVSHVLVVQVEQGRITWCSFPSLSPGQRISGLAGRLRPGTSETLARRLAQSLVESGLFPAEAWALVHTWQASFFATDGLRVLFLLPQAWTDRFIPIRVAPQPDQLVRVMVGRIEGLTRAREAKVAEAVRQLAHAPESSFRTLEAQGRYLQPILNRLVQVPALHDVRAGAVRLLQTDYVRTKQPASGSPAERLARLRRELRL